MDASARIACERGRVYRLYLDGRLTPLWPSQLATALANQRISIVSGRAKGTGLNWTAEFLFDFTESKAIPDKLDYVAMAKTAGPAPLDTTVRLSRYTCARLPAGTLEVRVSGPDQSGFLARFLYRTILLGLFLVEFEIDTQGTQINDRFVLISAGGVSPNAAVQQSLEDALRAFCES